MAAKQDRRREARAAKKALYRALVIEGATRVFAEKGYDDAKMEEIAAEAGLALGTLYTVFAGKAEIFGAIHGEADEALLARARAAGEHRADPVDAVLQGVRAYTGYFLEHPELLRMHLREGLSWGDEHAGAGSRARTDAWRAGTEMLAAAVSRCMTAGRFAPGDPRLVARMMIAMQQVQLAHWIESGMDREPRAILAAIEAQVLRSFAEPSESSARATK